MEVSRVIVLLLFLPNFLLLRHYVKSQELCKSCRRVEDCPQYTEMSQDLQNKWRQNYTCDGSTNNEYSDLSELSDKTVKKFVCCPTTNSSGINETSQNTEADDKINPNSYYGSSQNPNTYQNSDYGVNNNGFGQCALTFTPPNPETGCCGMDMSDSDRITGGQKTSVDQYPWTAFLSITFSNGIKAESFICGGSVISSRFILTAAHCVVGENEELVNLDVTLAEYDLRTFPIDCVGQVCINNLKIPAINVIVHPNFIKQLLINDVALIKLRDNAPYTRYIQPVCLPTINIDNPQFANLPLATAGWGMNVTVASDTKQFTFVHMVPKGECSEYYSDLTEGQICASGKNTEDTCKGDSGGPLMMVYRGKYYLAGIVSGKTAAFQCGTPVPSLYTNVYIYLDWIRNNVQ